MREMELKNEKNHIVIFEKPNWWYTLQANLSTICRYFIYIYI